MDSGGSDGARTRSFIRGVAEGLLGGVEAGPLIVVRTSAIHPRSGTEMLTVSISVDDPKRRLAIVN
jgi:hypothetical protein